MGERKRIAVRDIKALQPGKVIWDAGVVGLGARRQTGTAVAYVLFYRTAEGRQRWHTIGRHGAPWTPDAARTEAAKLLGRVAAGDDPAADKLAKRRAETVAELCDLYLAEAEAGRILKRMGGPKKASTLAVDRGHIVRHIKPLIGKRKVAAVTLADVQNLLHDIAGGKTAVRIKTGKRGLARVTGGQTTANRAVELLGAIYSWAVKRGICQHNPTRGVDRFASNRKERQLSDSEYQALGEALGAADDMWPAVIAATRFLTLTGWRSGEVLALTWKDIDLERRTAFLPDTKTGKSVRPLSAEACALLQAIPFQRTGLVFKPTKGNGLMSIKKAFRKIATLAGLPADITPHTMRHSFASVAADLGYSDLTIGALIGHKGRTMTSRYTHGADAVLLAAADAVAERITALMRGQQ